MPLFKIEANIPDEDDTIYADVDDIESAYKAFAESIGDIPRDMLKISPFDGELPDGEITIPFC